MSPQTTGFEYLKKIDFIYPRGFGDTGLAFKPNKQGSSKEKSKWNFSLLSGNMMAGKQIEIRRICGLVFRLTEKGKFQAAAFVTSKPKGSAR